ncbi:MAG: (d)CMP kinase [Luminiphilus sp.]|nr:(d)CMP kinase [Luminiphilus sp.]
MTKAPVICVDGPSGAGKGTLSTKLAAALGWHLLDSGALYRIVGHACVLRDISWQDEARVVDAAETLDVRFVPSPSGVSVWLAGEDVTAQIRSQDGSRGASAVAVLAQVRVALLERQRALAALPGLVADGRDMGTVVFPSAALKIFLTASPEARASRRQAQLLEKGESVSLPRLLDSINERDERDTNRSASPLVAAKDAVLIDSSALTVDAVCDRVLEFAADKGLIARSPN